MDFQTLAKALVIQMTGFEGLFDIGGEVEAIDEGGILLRTEPGKGYLLVEHIVMNNPNRRWVKLESTQAHDYVTWKT